VGFGSRMIGPVNAGRGRPCLTIKQYLKIAEVIRWSPR